MKTLIVGPNWVGDTVIAQSVVAELRAHDPAAVVHLLAPPWTAPLGQRMEGVAVTHELPSRHGRLELVRRVKKGFELRREAYDLAIVLPNSLKAAIIPLAAGIPVRRGYVGEKRYGLLNDIRTLNTRELVRTVDRFAALAHERQIAGFRSSIRPVLRRDADAAACLVARWGLDTTLPIIAICPGAEYGPSKRWPADHFAALVRILRERGFAVWLFGSANDLAVASAIESMVPDRASQLVNLCGKTTLLEALDLLGLAAGVVANDSGLMHVAAAIGQPVVALFGSTTPRETPPLTEQARVLERTLPCRPCFQRTCPLHHGECLRGISPREVATSLSEICGVLV